MAHPSPQAPSQPRSLARYSSLFIARIWFEEAPWRLSGFWSVLAAGLAAGLLGRLNQVDWPSLVLLLLLADLLWGSIWGMLADSTPAGPTLRATAPVRIWLPYLHPGSPAARLFGMDAPGLLPGLLRSVLPSILLAGLVAVTLGPTALWMTGAVVLLGLFAGLHRQVELIPVALLHSLATVALPWLLALEQFGIGSGHPAWNEQMALLGLWTLLAWGGERGMALGAERISLAMLAGAQLGIALLLILARAPLWLALLGVLWLPTWLAVHQGQPLAKVRLWWLLALFVSSMALGQLSA